MIDPNVILPLLQAMGKGDNLSQIEPLLSMMNNNSNTGANSQTGAGAQSNDMMKMLPMLMQMMNKGGNNNSEHIGNEPKDDNKNSDPFEPIRNIGNDNINSMLFNLMNRK